MRENESQVDGRAVAAGTRTEDRQAATDILFLTVVFLLLWLPHVGKIGFVSDDWVFVSRAYLSQDQSLPGLFSALYGDTGPRPLQFLYLATMYHFFGLNPLGYQIVNGIVVILCGAGFYLTLRALLLPRYLVLAAPLFFLVIPYYSTNRMWAAAFQIPLSILLYFVSLHLDLLTHRFQRLPALLIRLASALALIASLLAYELATFLFLLNPFVVYFISARTGRAARSNRVVCAVAISFNLALVLSVLIFKTQVADRAAVGTDFLPYLKYILRLFLLWPEDYGLNFWKAIYVNYFQYGVALPAIALNTFTGFMSPFSAAATAGAALATFAYLFLTGSRRSKPTSRYRFWLLVGAAGLVIFFTGYAIFFLTPQIQLTPTGIGNRTAMAAALGAAISLAAGVGFCSAAFRSTAAQSIVLASLTAVITASGVMVSNAIASNWSSANNAALETLSAIQQIVPSLPQDSTVILDGICPYVGPGIVFESSWDLAGALQIRYQDASIQANVITPSFELNDDAISMAIYGERSEYLYGSRTSIVNVQLGERVVLTDRDAAERYFERAGNATNQTCLGHAGVGIQIF